MRLLRHSYSKHHIIIIIITGFYIDAFSVKMQSVVTVYPLPRFCRKFCTCSALSLLPGDCIPEGVAMVSGVTANSAFSISLRDIYRFHILYMDLTNAAYYILIVCPATFETLLIQLCFVLLSWLNGTDIGATCTVVSELTVLIHWFQKYHCDINEKFSLRISASQITSIYVYL